MTQPSGPTRRRLLTAGGATLALGALAATSACSGSDDAPGGTPRAAAAAGRVDPHGPHQAGVHRPGKPPAHLNFQVLRAVPDVLTAASVRDTLAALGETITRLTAADPRDPRLHGEATGLTIQIGIGPRLLELTDTTVALGLPEFAGSAALPAPLRTGDLIISVAADRPETTAEVSDLVGGQVRARGYRPSWGQIGYRPDGAGTVTRNPLGFADGIVQPESTQGVPDHVFLASGAARGGSIGVVRRFALDTAGFGALSVDRQEALVGRNRSTGAPLSGGSQATDVNLTAKTPAGEYLVPAGSHVRSTHPSFTGSTLMLRRGYGFRESHDGRPDSSGLLFISYQDDVEVFSRTQLRMDREDKMMTFARPTAEAAFLVLPGFDRNRPLGSSLFG